ncbi:MAG: hypothetical protein EA384_16050 [Spirochaetaceae bacterium]|nr:MAG: hypothetical protein EA384_16050 [Spirochaetaceae bacterium]
MAVRRNQDEQVKAFWDQTEEELGEEVIVYAMGRCLSGCAELPPSAQMWGLFFITERALYFRHFPRQSWFNSLMSSSGVSADKEVYISVPMERIQDVAVHRESSFLKRLMSSTPPTFSIEYIEADASVQTLSFFVESKTDTFYKVIDSCRA